MRSHPRNTKKYQDGIRSSYTILWYPLDRLSYFKAVLHRLNPCLCFAGNKLGTPLSHSITRQYGIATATLKASSGGSRGGLGGASHPHPLKWTSQPPFRCFKLKKNVTLSCAVGAKSNHCNILQER